MNSGIVISVFHGVALGMSVIDFNIIYLSFSCLAQLKFHLKLLETKF